MSLRERHPPRYPWTLDEARVQIQTCERKHLVEVMRKARKWSQRRQDLNLEAATLNTLIAMSERWMETEEHE